MSVILAHAEVPGAVGRPGRPPQLLSRDPVRPAAPVAAAVLRSSRRVSGLGGMKYLGPQTAWMQMGRWGSEFDLIAPRRDDIFWGPLTDVLEMKAVAELRGKRTRIVEVESANGDGVVEQDAVVGDVEDAGGEGPFLAEGVAGGDIEGGVGGEICAVIRA